MVRRKRCGQQTTEFVVVLGIAAVVAVSMQVFARRAFSAGVKHASDTVFDVPPKKDGDTLKALDVNANQTITEQGKSGFQRQTTVVGSVKGHAVNEDERFRIIPAQ